MKRDMSREAVIRASTAANRTIERLKTLIPLGPASEELSQSEIKKMVAQAKEQRDGAKLSALVEMLGVQIMGKDGTSQS